MLLFPKIIKIVQKIKLYNDIYRFKTDILAQKSPDVFVYFGVVGDLVLYYNFLEQYCRSFSRQIIIVTLKNTLPFLRYMDQDNHYIDFETSVFFDPDPTERDLTISDRETLKQLAALKPNHAYAMPYETDFYTFLILNLISADVKLSFLASGQSALRLLLLQSLFPKIRCKTLAILPNSPRIQAHREAFYAICAKYFEFIGYNEPVAKPEYIVISPFASARDKEYPYEKFKEVSRELYVHYGIQSIYLGLTEMMEKDTEAISFEYNTPIEQLFERIRHCAFFIGNDSGLTHIALRYNKKTVVLFSRLKIYGLYFPYNNAIMICNKNISEIEPNEIVQKSIQ